MGFECPYLNENKCRLQNTHCIPAKGKCILKGKVKLASDYNKKVEDKEGSQE